MEYAPALIPYIVPELEAVKYGLDEQLKRLDEILAQRTIFILKQTTQEYRELVKKFMCIIKQYINKTLDDLFRFIDKVSDLARNYDQNFESFVDDAASIIESVQSCIKEGEAVISQHTQTISDLSQLASEITDLIRDYDNNSKNHLNGAVKARLIAGSLAVVCVAASASLAAVATPIAGIEALCVVSGGGGGIGFLVSKYDSLKSQIYTEAKNKLAQVEVCNGAFQAPIHAIYIKLIGNQQFLKNLQKDTFRATTNATTNIPEDKRQKSYETAQKEAQKIMEVCNDIRSYALKITILKGKLTHRAQQISGV
ncbi:hypothetical protein BGW42_003349 [Actinomortierella wolfii]|nr:hypothetical protein BGW42_003349 [Actinomortierella wolfii]